MEVVTGAGPSSGNPVSPPRSLPSVVGSSVDGSPLPTPPRVSHVYTAGAELSSPTARLPLKNLDGNVDDQRPSTFSLRSLKSNTPSQAGQRGVGTGLRKLRSAHVPARRVTRYQDDEEIDKENRQGEEPAVYQAEHNEGTVRVSANPDVNTKPNESSEPDMIQLRSASSPPALTTENKHELTPSQTSITSLNASCARTNPDFFQEMLLEAKRQGEAHYTPQMPPGEKCSARETTVSGDYTDVFQFRGCRFIKVRRAGEGGFSTVWQVRGPTSIPRGSHGVDNESMETIPESRQGYFAMKQVSLRRLEPESRDELVQEAQLLEQLAQQPGHEQYILRYFGHRLNKDTLKILLELGEMDFSSVLKTKGPLPVNEIHQAFRQMLEAVQFVHEKGNLVHTDLKPANFLLVRERLKLIDFGIAQKIPLGTIHISRDAIVGTPNYMAPEAIKIAKAHGRRVYKAGKASDVWSLGCILYQMVYGRPPFDRLASDRKLETIIDPSHKIAFPAHRKLDDPASEPVSKDLRDMLQSTLTYEPSQRAKIADLISNPLLSPITYNHHTQSSGKENLQISREQLRKLFIQLHHDASHGQLTRDNAIQQADAWFDQHSSTPTASGST
ncbi:dual-specificity kinase [Malassezia psittaci]|uniref:Dual-specificity kinase n=1 Tax=Malassezia psittaci TaxID=1821823 RepID=A0AAF0F7B7_9BASI|nr:dual-specificity kinase [Malassezia psittaci]